MYDGLRKYFQNEFSFDSSEIFINEMFYFQIWFQYFDLLFQVEHRICMVN